jgi:hypothetical protein
LHQSLERQQQQEQQENNLTHTMDHGHTKHKSNTTSGSGIRKKKIGRRLKHPKFNIIGFFNTIDTKNYQTCSIHPYKRCLPSKTDPNLVFCPQCGSEWKKEDTVAAQNIESKFGINNQTKIVSAKKKRKFYDKHGNEITDPELIQEMQGGHTVISYQEKKVEGEGDVYIAK